MKKQTLYTYLGTNGTITSPVHLEDIYYTSKCKLTADKDMVLTKDDEFFVETIVVPYDEVEEWKEVKKK